MGDSPGGFTRPPIAPLTCDPGSRSTCLVRRLPLLSIPPVAGHSSGWRSATWRCLVAAATCIAQVPVAAQIYTGATADGGGVVLSNFQTAETPRLLIAAPPSERPSPDVVDAPSKSTGESARPVALKLPAAPAELLPVIAEVAAQLRIAPELLHAVIAAESRYDSRALSPKGAVGLMQLLPATARRFGVNDPYVVRQNLFAGASYLKWLMALFDNDLELVLAAYNAGEQAVIRAGHRIPPYPETQAYVPRVLAYLRCASIVACKSA